MGKNRLIVKNNVDDWLMWTGIIVVLKLFLLAFCYCYRAEQRSKINRRLLREDVEIQRSGQNAINFVNNGQDQVYTVPNTNAQLIIAAHNCHKILACCRLALLS